MILYIEYNGGGDQLNLDLVGSNVACESFEPGIFATPGIWITDATARIIIKGKCGISAATNMIADLQVRVQTSINRDIGPRVYLYWHPTGDATDVHRAIVYSLQFILEGGSGEYYLQSQGRMVKAQLIISHGPWEGALTQVPISNNNDTDNLSGLTVHNTLDANYDNTIAIAANVIQGDLPAPYKLELTNTFNDADSDFNIFVSQNVNSDPANFVPILEAEGRGGADLANAAASGGWYTGITVDTTETDRLSFALNSAFLTRAAGNQFHVFATSFPAFGAEVFTFMRMGLMPTGVTAQPGYYFGEQVSQSSVSWSFWDIGIIRLPPWYIDPNATSLAIDLVLYTQSTDGNTYTLRLDSLYLMPVDGFRHLITLGGLYGFPFNSRLVDDQTEHDSYTDTGVGTSRKGNVVANGTQILLQPNKYQKLYFLTNTYVGNYDIDRSFSVKLYYRPLRLTL